MVLRKRTHASNKEGRKVVPSEADCPDQPCRIRLYQQFLSRGDAVLPQGMFDNVFLVVTTQKESVDT